MLLYNPYKKYNYSVFGKLDIQKQLNLIYTMLDVYGDQDYSDVYTESGSVFDVSLHYQPKTNFFFKKKMIAVEINTTVISKNVHIPNSLYKKSISYHTSFKNLRLDSHDCELMFEQDAVLSKFIYISYIPVKLGITKLSRFKDLHMEDD